MKQHLADRHNQNSPFNEAKVIDANMREHSVLNQDYMDYLSLVYLGIKLIVSSFTY